MTNAESDGNHGTVQPKGVVGHLTLTVSNTR